MDPLRGRLVLRGVAAAVPGSRPFLTADEAEVEIDVREGLRRRLHVRHVAAEGVRIDLGAPLPASQGTSTGDLTFLSAAEIDQIDVGISSFVSGPLPPSLQDVALGARIEKARLTGSLRGGTLRLRGDLPTVVVDRPGPLRLPAARRRRALADGGREDRPRRAPPRGRRLLRFGLRARPASPPKRRSPSTPR